MRGLLDFLAGYGMMRLARSRSDRRDERRAARAAAQAQPPSAVTGGEYSDHGIMRADGSVHLSDGRIIPPAQPGHLPPLPRYPLSGRAAKPAKVEHIVSPWGDVETREEQR